MEENSGKWNLILNGGEYYIIQVGKIVIEASDVDNFLEFK